MSFLLALLIVAAQAAAPSESRQPDAVEIFHCGFEAAADRDVDSWPDGWTRTRGPNFPAYLPIEILRSECPEGRCALRMKLNGGGAAIYTTPIEVGSRFSYVLEGYLKTEGLKANRAFISITFFDAQGNLLETLYSERHQTIASSRKVRLGPLTAAHENSAGHHRPAPGTASGRGRFAARPGSTTSGWPGCRG